MSKEFNITWGLPKERAEKARIAKWDQAGRFLLQVKEEGSSEWALTQSPLSELVATMPPAIDAYQRTGTEVSGGPIFLIASVLFGVVQARPFAFKYVYELEGESARTKVLYVRYESAREEASGN